MDITVCVMGYRCIRRVDWDATFVAGSDTLLNPLDGLDHLAYVTFQLQEERKEDDVMTTQ